METGDRIQKVLRDRKEKICRREEMRDRRGQEIGPRRYEIERRSPEI